ncbi:type II toxin-antitoxin system VapC family toxin (plasmid) [Skermanella mucosa]|uniref:type II toxin-antitoxin system VapC family toxin n=1 Tax=Skermanella mucosa TaxID=1789672 RepID=UPI00192B8912|nr:type II toxin-antitoxin system VapC family toxin [Skermanella mucosa]UEM25175.1 type II toxin-antitoxin system VapC family toxin [Skermanella mucosa]
MPLLDTHTILWLDGGLPMTQEALDAIEEARPKGGVLVSPVSAWEIGTLVRKGRIVLDVDPVSWIHRFLGQPGVRQVPLTVDAAAGSSFLPESFHGDPADRMLVASARQLGVPMITRDRKILEYAASTSAVRAIRC